MIETTITDSSPNIRASFRDPKGRVVFVGKRCFRATTTEGNVVLESFLATEVAQRWLAQGKLIPTRKPESVPHELFRVLGVEQCPNEIWAGVVEHETVEFANYPHAWSAEMFESAARLTLEVAAGVLPFGFSLKDATPRNIMFRGPEPVFVDLLSFEPRDECERVWMAYGQFVRSFLFPLIIWRARGVPPRQHFLSKVEGIKPAECFRRLGCWRSLQPPALTLCAMPTVFAWWARRHGKTTSAIRRARAHSAEEALFVLQRLLRRLERALDQITMDAPAKSEWTNYAQEVTKREFATGYFEAKRRFVGEALDLVRPRSCLDIGCNTGYFSFMAADGGARVVSIDRDDATVGAVYRRAQAAGRHVLPLVVDIARPTPAVGWNNSESLSFLDRASGARFELVMMLGLIHHLCLVERVPLSEVAKLASRLAPRWLLIEFIPREDPLAQQMPDVWIGDSDWAGYDRAVFEAAFGAYFLSLRSVQLTGSNRWIYLMERSEE